MDFCSKDTVPDIRSDQVRLFIDKLREKRQTEAQQEQAAYPVSLYFELQRKPDNGAPQNLTTSQKVKKPVIATPDLIRGKQSPPWQLADSWGLLRRFTPRNDSPGDFLRNHQNL